MLYAEKRILNSSKLSRPGFDTLYCECESGAVIWHAISRYDFWSKACLNPVITQMNLMEK